MEPKTSDLIQSSLRENSERIEALGQEVREICSLSKDLLEKWLVDFQKENKVEFSVVERAESYYDVAEIWKFSENCSWELSHEVVKMEVLAEKFGWDLKSICKRIKK